MMSEIEKMYENAGIEKEKKQQCVQSYKTENGIGICIDFNKRDDYLYFYPPFTAEKQLELIKWLMNKSFSYSTVEDKDGVKYWFEIDYETSSHGFKSFEETIADTINEMWQNLTEEEHKQIKNILESEVRE